MKLILTFFSHDQAKCLALTGSTPITIDDTLGPQAVPFALSSKPSGPVSVTFTASGLTFDKCTLSFTPDDWNIPQTVNVTPVLVASSGTVNVNIQSRVTSGSGACGTGKTELFPVVRKVSSLLTCLSTGDPHLMVRLLTCKDAISTHVH